MNVLGVQKLALWDGIDAVFWKNSNDQDLQAASAEVRDDGVIDMRYRQRHLFYRDEADVIACMAPHLPQPEAIIEVGKHNVRVFYQSNDLLLVFIRIGHPSAKSIKRAIRRVFARQ